MPGLRSGPHDPSCDHTGRLDIEALTATGLLMNLTDRDDRFRRAVFIRGNNGGVFKSLSGDRRITRLPLHWTERSSTDVERRYRTDSAISLLRGQAFTLALKAEADSKPIGYGPA